MMCSVCIRSLQSPQAITVLCHPTTIWGHLSRWLPACSGIGWARRLPTNLRRRFVFDRSNYPAVVTTTSGSNSTGGFIYPRSRSSLTSSFHSRGRPLVISFFWIVLTSKRCEVRGMGECASFQLRTKKRNTSFLQNILHIKYKPQDLQKCREKTGRRLRLPEHLQIDRAEKCPHAERILAQEITTSITVVVATLHNTSNCYTLIASSYWCYVKY